VGVLDELQVVGSELHLATTVVCWCSRLIAVCSDGPVCVDVQGLLYFPSLSFLCWPGRGSREWRPGMIYPLSGFLC
jgi:hypothetical protein